MRLLLSNRTMRWLIAALLFTIACDTERTSSGHVSGTKKHPSATAPTPTRSKTTARDSINATVARTKTIADSIRALPDSTFIPLLALDSSFIEDMRYATDSNFLQARVYECDRCFLRKEVAEALQRANVIFQKKGYRIKLFDCYRPLDVQKKMWVIMPDDRYVGNPYGNGSVHNKGAAVDITLVDAQGNEVDMGTGFDHFGREAHHAYQDLPESVLAHRRLLKEVMESVGFKAITSEWWHYSFRNAAYPVANFKPAC